MRVRMKLAPPRMFNKRSLVVLTIVIGMTNAYKRIPIGIEMHSKLRDDLNTAENDHLVAPVGACRSRVIARYLDSGVQRS
jgi:hypothetical protein